MGQDPDRFLVDEQNEINQWKAIFANSTIFSKIDQSRFATQRKIYDDPG